MLAPETPALNINEGNLGFKLNFELKSDKNNYIYNYFHS